MCDKYVAFASRTIPDKQGNFMHVEVLKVTADGKFIWHSKADKLIENCEDPAMKCVLQALRKNGNVSDVG